MWICIKDTEEVVNDIFDKELDIIEIKKYCYEN